MRVPRFAEQVALLFALMSMSITSQAQTPRTSTQKSGSPQQQQSRGVPDQQRQFCAAYQEDTDRRNRHDAEVAAAIAKVRDNPVAKSMIHLPEPDYERLFRARQAAVMGKAVPLYDGEFRNWIASVKLDLSGDQISLTFEFPCKWTEYGYRPNMSDRNSDYQRGRTHDTLSFGMGGILLNSDVGKSLASVVQGETVTVLGRLFCVAPSSPPANTPDGGCTRDASGMLWASIGMMRSVKNGTPWKFPITRRNGVFFNLTDDFETLMEKSRRAGASALGEYLQDVVVFGRSLSPLSLSPGAPPYFYARVPGDMPSLIGQPPLQKPTPFPAKHGDCYVVRPEDQAALENTTKQIDRILGALLDTKLLREPGSARPNPCIDVDGNPKPAPRKIYDLGPGISPPVPTFQPEPSYTEEAKKAKLQGAVMLSVVVDESGKVTDIKVMKSLGKGLDEKAAEAAAKWKFRPATRYGRPVPVNVTIEMKFRYL